LYLISYFTYFTFDSLHLISTSKVPPQIQAFDFGSEAANTGEISGGFCMVPKGSCVATNNAGETRQSAILAVNG